MTPAMVRPEWCALRDGRKKSDKGKDLGEDCHCDGDVEGRLFASTI